MSQMNRWWRREMQRAERRRQQRVEALARRREARRRRLAERVRRDRPRVSFGEWLRRPYKPADLILLGLVAWLLPALAAGALAGVGMSEAVRRAVIVLVQQAGIAVAVLAYLRSWAREGVEWLGPPGAQAPAWRILLVGAGAGAALWGLGWGIVRGLGPWIGRYTAAPELPLPAVTPEAGALALAAVLVGAPLADELFYRRWVMRWFARAGTPDRTAVLFSALLYGLWQGPGGSFVGFLAGLAYASVYARTQATLAVVVMHLVFNAMAWTVPR